MRTIGMFKTKTHLPKLIKEMENGADFCITNRGREVAFIISVNKYYNYKIKHIIRQFIELKKRSPLGNSESIIKMKSEDRK